MEFCHPEEHTSCFRYSIQSPSIEIIELKAKENIQTYLNSNQLIFVMKGVLDLTGKRVQNKRIGTGESVLIPSHNPYIITVIEDVSIMSMKLNFNITFCDFLSLELLLKAHGKIKKDSTGIGMLSSHQRLTGFVNTMQTYIDEGLKCEFFFDIKIREFLFLIRAYYSRQTVIDFFASVYTPDFIFSSKVYENLNETKTIKDMADKLHYSPSGFDKKFKKVFGISPHKWMQGQKAKKIYHEILCTKKLFVEMAFEYGFSSPAHFNIFCKLFFGRPPGELRKEKIKQSILLLT